jgi:hypothetical protein
MKPGVDLEGSQTSSASLPVDDLRRRVAGTVGRLDASGLTQPVMRPDHGVRFSGKCPILLLFCTESPLIFTVGAFVRP